MEPDVSLAARYEALVAERNALEAERRLLRQQLDELRGPRHDPARLVDMPPHAGRGGQASPMQRRGLAFADWVREQVAAEAYFFQKIELAPGLVTPGWSDPKTEKLPYFGLPEDLTGLRVLDIGCAEGFFSFEAERRGAREVVAIDSFPDSIRRFGICRAALGSKAAPYLCNVYDLNPRAFGTFDLVLFYGVFYHLRHPALALERILSVCTGTLLLQTYAREQPGLGHVPLGEFHPRGLMSGPNQDQWDPTVFWLFNGAGCLGLLEAAGFLDAEVVSSDPHPFVVRARSPVQSQARVPDQTTSPWS